MTFVKWGKTCQKAKYSKDIWKEPRQQKTGIGHSVIRGLGTAGQWSAWSSTVYFRGSQMCRHSIIVDS